MLRDCPLAGPLATAVRIERVGLIQRAIRRARPIKHVVRANVDQQRRALDALYIQRSCELSKLSWDIDVEGARGFRVALHYVGPTLSGTVDDRLGLESGQLSIQVGRGG